MGERSGEKGKKSRCIDVISTHFFPSFERGSVDLRIEFHYSSETRRDALNNICWFHGTLREISLFSLLVTRMNPLNLLPFISQSIKMGQKWREHLWKIFMPMSLSSLLESWGYPQEVEGEFLRPSLLPETETQSKSAGCNRDPEGANTEKGLGKFELDLGTKGRRERDGDGRIEDETWHRVSFILLFLSSWQRRNQWWTVVMEGLFPPFLPLFPRYSLIYAPFHAHPRGFLWMGTIGEVREGESLWEGRWRNERRACAIIESVQERRKREHSQLIMFQCPGKCFDPSIVPVISSLSL